MRSNLRIDAHCFFNFSSFWFWRILESCKSSITPKLYSERAVKLWDSQTAIDELLEELQNEQQKMAMEGQHMHERTKVPVKTEQEKSARVKTENKVTSKSLFYGTSLATSSPVLDTSFQSDSSETSQNEN